MKTYNALIITDKDRINILYECDNKKNTRCKGHNNCRECEYTTELRYAKDISTEQTRLELKKELKDKEREIEEYKQIIRYLMKEQNNFQSSQLTLNQIRKIYNLKPM